MKENVSERVLKAYNDITEMASRSFFKDGWIKSDVGLRFTLWNKGKIIAAFHEKEKSKYQEYMENNKHLLTPESVWGKKRFLF